MHIKQQKNAALEMMLAAGSEFCVCVIQLSDGAEGAGRPCAHHPHSAPWRGGGPESKWRLPLLLSAAPSISQVPMLLMTQAPHEDDNLG